MSLLLLFRLGGTESAGPADPISGLPVVVSGLVPWTHWDSFRDQRGIVYLANGVDRPLAWNGIDAAARNWGIDAPSTNLAAAGGAGGNPNGTYFYYYAFVNENVTPPLISNPSPISSSVTVTNDQVDLSSIDVSSDTQVTHKYIYRNTDGQTATFYKIGSVAAATTTFTDDIADATALAGDVLEFDHDVPDSKRPYIAFLNGRAHLFGSRVERTGTIAISGTTVTGTGTEFRASQVGQNLLAIPTSGAPIERSISAHGGDTSLTITASATIAAGAAYSIVPSASRSLWAWSKAGEVEYFPAENSTNVFEGDGDEPTGLFILRGSLFAMKRRHLYNLIHQNDPNPLTGDGGIFPSSEARGCINDRCAVTVGTMAYLMDESGIYAFDGSSIQEIDLPINRLVVNSPEPSAGRVNWAAADSFHAIYDPKRKRVLWFVAIGADTRPKHALCYELQRQRWSVEEYPFEILCSVDCEDQDGRFRAWIGDENGYFWAVGVGPVEGAPPEGVGTLRGTATSGSSTTLGDSGAAFHTTGDGLDGCPVSIIAGTGSGQTRIISSNTATELTVAVAWTTNPDSTSQYIVGGIASTLVTKWYSTKPAPKSRLKALRLYFDPMTDDFEMTVKLYRDFSATAFAQFKARHQKDSVEASGDTITIHMNDDEGFAEVPIGEQHARFIRFQLAWQDTGRKPNLRSWDFDMIEEPGSQRTGG